MDEELQTRLPLTVDGLVVRRVDPNDFDDVLEYCSDPEVARYQIWPPYTPDQVAEFIDAQADMPVGGPGMSLLLVVELDGKVIGDCQLTVAGPDDPQAEIGFAFNPQFTGQGFASRAVAAVLGFAFVQLGMHRVTACTDVRNERSWRLMERVGMRREAHFIHDAFVKGEWVDDYVYAMPDHEWHERHPSLARAVAVELD